MFFSRPAGDKYVNRGDCPEYDFTLADLITRDEWTCLDLSSVVGSGIKLVHIICQIWRQTTAGAILLRPHSFSGSKNIVDFCNANTLWLVAASDFVETDKDGCLDYYLYGGLAYTTLNLTIKGWFTK